MPKKNKEIKPFFIDQKQYKAVDIPDQYKTQEICEKLVSKETNMLKYCVSTYKTLKMYDRAVDACLLALKFVPDQFVLSKMFQILDNVIFSNDDIDLDYMDCDIATFFSDDMDLK